MPPWSCGPGKKDRTKYVNSITRSSSPRRAKESAIRSLLWITLLLAPNLLSAQGAPPEVRADIDTLLEGDSIDVTLFDLPERFFGHVILLIPDLEQEDQEILAASIEQGFDPLRVRADMVDFIAASASASLVDPLMASRNDGAEAEMRRLTEGYTPDESFEAFVQGLNDPPTDRLRMLAGLADARGAGDFDLLLDQLLGAAAYRLVTMLGGEPPPFRPLTDEAFEAAYRQRILTRALELLYTTEEVPDQVVERVTDLYMSEEGRWYVDQVAEAMQSAALEAGRRVEARFVGPTDEVAASVAGIGPCQEQACGYLVDWQGSPPTDTNRRFGAAGDLDARVLQYLSLAGYQITRGLNASGFTIRMRPRTMTAICDFMSGTDNQSCRAIDEVRIDFIGSNSEVPIPGALLVRNRCGSDELMDVEALAVYVAARLRHALMGGPQGQEPSPGC